MRGVQCGVEFGCELSICVEFSSKIDVNYIYKIQSVPRSKHSVSVIQTSQSMLYRDIIAVCSQIHTKHINTLCGRNVEFVNVKPVVHIVTTVRYI
jgi:hypothetical protein